MDVVRSVCGVCLGVLGAWLAAGRVASVLKRGVPGRGVVCPGGGPRGAPGLFFFFPPPPLDLVWKPRAEL